MRAGGGDRKISDKTCCGHDLRKRIPPYCASLVWLWRISGLVSTGPEFGPRRYRDNRLKSWFLFTANQNGDGAQRRFQLHWTRCTELGRWAWHMDCESTSGARR
jgi:hypothetical protein